MRGSFICLIIALAAQAVAQQKPEWVWQPPGMITRATAVALDGKGAVYAVGANSGAAYIVRLNEATGDSVWTRSYKVTNSETFYDVAVIPDGYIIPVGRTNNQYTVLHYLSDGTLRKRWTDTQHQTSGSYAVAVCADDVGAAYVTGNADDLGSSYNMYSMEFSSQGDSLWSHVYYSPLGGVPDIAYDIALVPSGGCYVTGTTGGHILTMRLSATGDTVWTRRYHGPTAGTDVGYGVAVDGFGNVYVAGESSVGGKSAATVISYTSGGTLRFAKTYSSPAKIGDSFADIAIDRDSGVVATGVARTGIGVQATLVAKYLLDGDSLWVQRYRPSTADASEGERIAVDSEGKIYVVGQSRTGNYDITTLSYGPTGAFRWAILYPGPTGSSDTGVDIALGDSGRVIVAGVMESMTSSAFTVLCYKDLATSVAPASRAIPGEYTLEQNYPNPFNPTTEIRYQVSGVSNVKLVVYDLLGREVAVLVDEVKMPGRFEVLFDAKNLPSGVYLYRLSAGNYVQTRRCVLLR